MSDRDGASRRVPAVHGRRRVEPDPDYEIGLARHLRETHERPSLLALYARFAHGPEELDAMMRRILWRAIARRCGHGLRVGVGVGFKHLETFEIGDGVAIGDHAYLQGRFDGHTVFGNHCWIGPQAYLDARDLEIGEHVGWGPGAKVIGSAHTGQPIDVPVIETDLLIRPVRVEAWADVGAGAVLLPGVRIGQGSLIGAGAVVTRDVPPFSVAAGVPARVLRRRDESGGEPDDR